MSLTERIYDASPVWMQNLLVSAYGRRLYQKRYSGIYNDILQLVKASRDWTSEQANVYQAERLHEMVKHCRETVPYYQKLFASHGLHENDFTSVEDVTRLPILTKATLKEQPEDFRSTGGDPFMVQHTSGSTGSPLELEVDEYTYKLAMALLVDHEEAHGIPFGAPRATFAGRMIQPASRFKPPYSRLNRAENQRIFSSYHLSAKTFPCYAEELDNFRPAELIGYPSAISDLASHYIASGTKPGFRPSAVITNSETLLGWQRKKIEAVFGCTVFDYYGTAEYVLFASQDTDRTYRLNPVIGITEVLPPSAAGLADNRLLATTLTNRVMPLLRYEVGDTAEPTDRSSPTVVHQLARVNGRVDDYIELTDGLRVGRLDHVFKGVDELEEAQIVQDAADHCTIYIVVDNAHSEAAKARIKENFEKRVGHGLSVSIEQVSNIPRGKNGKFKNVVRAY
jgi:phenylacetate-CoA ligase